MNGALIADNEWHDGFIYKQILPGGGHQFAIVADRDAILEDPLHEKIPVSPEYPEGGVPYSEVRYNWNHGQPKTQILCKEGWIDASIVDTDIKHFPGGGSGRGHFQSTGEIIA